jgi:outer membrane protein assembly factor BamB
MGLGDVRKFTGRVSVLAAACTVSPAVASDWTNLGGGPTRSGQSGVVGPVTETLLWENDDDFSVISWHPVISGGRVFAIREAGFPSVFAANDVLVAYDLDTGAELWRTVVPYANDPDEEWIAYVAGASSGPNGHAVYAARGGSGRTTPVYAFDAETGGLLWASAAETVAGPQDGVVFGPGGDLFVGDFDSVARIDAADGTTVWETPRACPVSGNCGVAIGPDGVFYDEPAAVGPDLGNRVVKLDIGTGARLYESDLLIGFTAQNAPFLSPDGSRVYFSRTQNNEITDFLYAFDDTGASLETAWLRPVRWTTGHEHGIGADGSIYTFVGEDELVRLDPATGDVTATAGTLSPIGVGLSPRTAVDAAGTVYVSNGWASTPATDGRLWAFSADLSIEHFVLELDRQNSGGPSLGAVSPAGPGTLVVADRRAVYAYRDAPAGCNAADLVGPVGVLDLADIQAFVAAFGAGDPLADLAPPAGVLDLADIAAFVEAFLAGCP